MTDINTPEPRKSFTPGFRLTDQTQNSASRLFDSEVTKRVHSIDELQPSREMTYEQQVVPSRSQSSFHSYSNVEESQSTMSQVMLDNMPPHCRMVLLQQTTAGTTYSTALLTESFTHTSLTSQSVHSQMSYRPITSSIAPKPHDADSSDLSEPDSLTESDPVTIDELEKIRRDLRLSRVIVSDDQTTLVSYLVDEKQTPRRRPLGMTPSTSTPKSTRELIYGKQRFTRFDQDPLLEQGIPYDQKGSPAGTSEGVTPTQSTSSAPSGMKPTHIMYRKPRKSSTDSSPMVTRLEELYRKSRPTSYKEYGWLMDKTPEKPKKDEYDLPSVEKLRTRLSRKVDGPPGRPAEDSPSDVESEVGTTDSETDSESWQAVMDFQSPYLHEDPRFWPYTSHRKVPGEPSTDSEVYDSDDDNQTVCGEIDLATLRGLDASSSDDDTDLHPGGTPRRRRPVSKFKSSLLRKELALSEVVSPKSLTTLTRYQSRPDGGSPLAGKRSKSESDLRSAAPSITGHGMSRAELVPADTRYARVVQRVQDTRPSWGRYSRLSTSESDISRRTSSSLHHIGKF